MELKKLSTETFVESFAQVNTKKDMEMYLSKSFNENTLLEELKNPLVMYYFALLNKEPVGYLKLNFSGAQTDVNAKDSLEIERIYVRKAFQGKQLGQALFNKAMEVAREHKMKNIWLGVWEKNPGAIRFYKRNGFVEFGKHPFVLGEDLQTDILMKLEI